MISKPRSATRACVLAQLRCSAKASSGSAWIECDNSIKSPRCRWTTSSTVVDAVAVGILAVSHRRSALRAGARRRPLRFVLVTSAPTDPQATADAAAAELLARAGVDSFDVAVVLGSGWAPAAAEL